MEDVEYDRFKLFLESDYTDFPPEIENKQNFKRDAKKYTLKDGLLYRKKTKNNITKELRVLRESDKESLWECYHSENSHVGNVVFFYLKKVDFLFTVRFRCECSLQLHV